MVAEFMIDETTARLNTHEAVCSHRYEQIMEKFDHGTEKMGHLENKLTKLDKKLAWASGVLAAFTTFGPHVFDIIRSLLK